MRIRVLKTALLVILASIVLAGHAQAFTVAFQFDPPPFAEFNRVEWLSSDAIFAFPWVTAPVDPSNPGIVYPSFTNGAPNYVEYPGWAVTTGSPTFLKMEGSTIPVGAPLNIDSLVFGDVANIPFEIDVKTFNGSVLVEHGKFSYLANSDLQPDNPNNWTWTQYSVPEPATLLLLGLSFVGLAGFRRRFK